MIDDGMFRLLAAQVAAEAGFGAVTGDALHLLAALAEAHARRLAKAAVDHAALKARTAVTLADLDAALSSASSRSATQLSTEQRQQTSTQQQTIISTAAAAPDNTVNATLSPSESLVAYALRQRTPRTPIARKLARITRDRNISSTKPNNNNSSSFLLFSHKEFLLHPPPSDSSALPPDAFLPKYPSVHTYKRGEISGQRESDIAKLREIKALRARQVDANLRRLLLAREHLVQDDNDNDSAQTHAVPESAAVLIHSTANNDLFVGGATSGVGQMLGSVNYQLQRK
ncbi:hypothetical protein HK100_006969 [Physocladia obscura]|uniref:Transcription factor TFIID subunit 8 C-terminal domain-containing protein n=1 Tax=Physocladia obscura TaxID=109957 RepID=A0AAD5XK74_9FUNG|nr:hypothetical protein HK100_006969 [Physocladia obscura]